LAAGEAPKILCKSSAESAVDAISDILSNKTVCIPGASRGSTIYKDIIFYTDNFASASKNCFVSQSQDGPLKGGSSTNDTTENATEKSNASSRVNVDNQLLYAISLVFAILCVQ
jgi:hypothetical protein